MSSDWMQRFPVRKALLGATAFLTLYSCARWVDRAFQPVAPGEAGLVVNKYTGATRVVSPGSHFLPPSFYILTRMRVSDQLLSGPAATFQVPTRDGFAVGLAIQARWALDRGQLLARWAGLPQDPGTELVGPVLASSFRALAPEYDATSLLASAWSGRRRTCASRSRRSRGSASRPRPERRGRTRRPKLSRIDGSSRRRPRRTR